MVSLWRKRQVTETSWDWTQAKILESHSAHLALNSVAHAYIYSMVLYHNLNLDQEPTFKANITTFPLTVEVYKQIHK